jgi:hypothetical protein
VAIRSNDGMAIAVHLVGRLRCGWGKPLCEYSRPRLRKQAQFVVVEVEPLRELHELGCKQAQFTLPMKPRSTRTPQNFH